MKTLYAIAFLCAGSFALAQSVQDYPFVTVSSKSKDFSGNKYGMETLLGKQLSKKNYTVLGGDKMTWPAEAQNPCSVLTANLVNTSGLLRNKVAVDFRDCNDKSVGKFEGTSLEKEFETGYPDALNKAMALIPASSGKISAAMANTQPVVTQQREEPKREEPAKVLHTRTEAAPVASAAAKAEVFSNGTLNLNRIVIAPNQFILANPNTSVPYAIFKETTRSDVFRVQLENGVQSLGYYENGGIVVELPNSDGTYRKEVFGKR